MTKRVRATEELEGFTLDHNRGVWLCEYNVGTSDVPKYCGRQYVVKWRAEEHQQSHWALAQIKSKVVPKQTIGGEVLREAAEKITQGVINVPELVKTLTTAAWVIDDLLREIQEADIRSLTAKARVFDRFVEAYQTMQDELNYYPKGDSDATQS